MGRFILIAVAIGIIYMLIKGDKKKKLAKNKVQESKLKASGDLVQDPVCGSYVDINGQIRVREGDTVHYFCSYECRDAYLKRLQGADEDAPESKDEDQA